MRNFKEGTMSGLCYIFEKPCENWDGEECLAVHPCQCPYTTKEEDEALMKDVHSSMMKEGKSE